MSGDDRVARMAQHRAAMLLALQGDGLSLEEATKRLARERWLEADKKLQARRQCGTATTQESAQPAGPFDLDPADMPRPEPWWQRL